MDFQNKEVWIGAEDLTNDPKLAAIAKQEFHHTSLVDTVAEDAAEFTANRRDFLKYLGFGLGAATIAACQTPIARAVPFVRKPDTIVPGVATYYASSFVNGGDYASILVKTREGRPIKIESNTLSKVTPEGSSARAQALVLSLYDTSRFPSAGKIEGGKYVKSDWNTIDGIVKSKLADTNAVILVVSGTNMSPTAKKTWDEFKAKYPNTTFVQYDAVSSAALLAANGQCFGDAVVPNYKFENAEYIVSFGADFLGTWISPIEYSTAYAKNRKLEDSKNAKMSRHVQVESAFSLTGSNADHRILVKPSEQGAAIAALYNAVAAATGVTGVSAPAVNEKAAKALVAVAKELVEKKGKALVVSGSNNVGEQVLVNKINDMLGSYGNTIDFSEASMQRQGNEANLYNAINTMKTGAYAAVFFMNCNPVFDTPWSEDIKAGLSKTGLKVSFAPSMDETTVFCDVVAPSSHILESWGDAMPKRGHYSLIQPTITQIFDTRQTETSLLMWAASPNFTGNYYDYLKANWEKTVFTAQREFATTDNFWDMALHNGVVTVAVAPKAVKCGGDAAAAAAQITQPGSAELEIAFFESINIGDGRYAGNPWLMEMPDPVTRGSWDNHLLVPIKWDGINDFNGFKGSVDGTKMTLKVAGKDATPTAIRQFGLAENTVAMAVGYGREQTPAGKGVGTNVYPMMKAEGGYFQYFATVESVENAGSLDDTFACVQYHHTLGVKGEGKEENNEIINVDEKALGYKGFQGSLTERTIIFPTSLSDLTENVEKLKEKRAEFAHLNAQTLYPSLDDRYKLAHHWNMYVDLNACTGCGACTVACMSENNVPIVGKKEVHRQHEMTWLRIDRYYYGDVENPSVVYQPMMCQHCDNAPCENVCPVAATNHSSEGLNQMTYNRCIGTRYCANNCPFKVRRFNWLDYTTADMFGWNENYSNDGNMNDANGLPLYADNLIRMVLNPDVTVRSRGVIEKCSFCVQRIQEGKLTAKRENRQLRDSDIKTACQTSCPTGAITFGDRNAEGTALAKKLYSDLTYKVIEETNVAPNVSYTMKVRNRTEALETLKKVEKAS